MSYPYYRHVASTSTSRSTSSTSTSPPPTAPTIRVTSPVPDEVSVIDIWDPEVPEQVPQSYTKTYSFRYREEEKLVEASKESSKGHDDSGEFLLEGDSKSFLRRRLSEDDGLATGESDDSSDVDDCSQVTTVTAAATQNDPLKETTDPHLELLQPDSDEEIPKVPCSTPVGDKDSVCHVYPTSDDSTQMSQGKEDELEALLENSVKEELDKESHRRSLMKRVQFSRSFSYAREADDNAGAVGKAVAAKAGKIQSRRYSSFDVQSSVDSSQLVAFVPHRTLLSPTPEVLHESSSPAVEHVDNPILPSPKHAPKATEKNITTVDLGEEAPRIEIHHAAADGDAQTISLLSRLASLKQDTKLVEIASSFVSQVIARAQEEARHRSLSYRADQKAKLSLDLQGIVKPKTSKRNPWYRRLRVILLRTLSCTCVPPTPGNIQSPLSN